MEFEKMKALPRPRILLSLLLLLALGAGFLLLRPVSAEAPAVMTAEVERGDLEVSVLAQGILKPRNLVAVGAQASGRITAITVAIGQVVKKGDLIAEIDSVNQKNDLQTAKASLEHVKAQRAEKQASLELARLTLERQTEMQKTKISARMDYDSAAAEVKVTQAQIAALDAQIEQAEIAIQTAEANLGYTRITAPSDGTVLAIVAQEGQTVNAAQSAPTIVVLGDLAQMEVHAEISEADVVNVQPGQKVWFTILGDTGRRYEATLESVAPAPESIVNDSSISSSTSSSSSTTSEAIYYNGLFTVPNPDGRLRSYMTAEVHVVLGQAQQVLIIPALALGPQGHDGNYTVRVQGAGGQIAERNITTGLNDKVMVEVTEGLAEGDLVVTGEAAAGGSGSGRSGGGFGGPMPRMGR